jgi:hypothetical protein
VHLRFLLFFSQVHSVSLRKRWRRRAGGRGQDGVVERRVASRARGFGEFDAVQLAGQPSRGKSAGRTPDRSRARRRNGRRARRNARTTPRSRDACRASDPARTDRRARRGIRHRNYRPTTAGRADEKPLLPPGGKRPRGRARDQNTHSSLPQQSAMIANGTEYVHRRPVASVVLWRAPRPSRVDAPSGEDDDEARGSLSKTSPRHFPYVSPVLKISHPPCLRPFFTCTRFFHPGQIRRAQC